MRNQLPEGNSGPTNELHVVRRRFGRFHRSKVFNDCKTKQCVGTRRRLFRILIWVPYKYPFVVEGRDRMIDEKKDASLHGFPVLGIGWIKLVAKRNPPKSTRLSDIAVGRIECFLHEIVLIVEVTSRVLIFCNICTSESKRR